MAVPPRKPPMRPERDRLERAPPRPGVVPGRPLGLQLKKHATFDAVRAQHAIDRFPASTRSQFLRLLQRAEEALAKTQQAISEAKAQGKGATALESEGRKQAVEVQKLRDQRPIYSLGSPPRDWPKDPTPEQIEAAAVDAMQLSEQVATLQRCLVTEPPELGALLEALGLRWPEDPPPEQVLRSLRLDVQDLQLYLVYGMLAPRVVLLFKELEERRGAMQAAKARVTQLFTQLAVARLELEGVRLGQQEEAILSNPNYDTATRERRLEQLAEVRAALTEREQERVALQRTAQEALGELDEGPRPVSGTSLRIRKLAEAVRLPVLPTDTLRFAPEANPHIGGIVKASLRDAAGERGVTCRAFRAKETDATIQRQVGLARELSDDQVGPKTYGLVELPTDEVLLVQAPWAFATDWWLPKAVGEALFALLTRLRETGYLLKEPSGWGLGADGRALLVDGAAARKSGGTGTLSVPAMLWRARKLALGPALFDGDPAGLREALASGEAWVQDIPAAQRSALGALGVSGDEVLVARAPDDVLRVVESTSDEDTKSWRAREIALNGAVGTPLNRAFAADGRDL